MNKNLEAGKYYHATYKTGAIWITIYGGPGMLVKSMAGHSLSFYNDPFISIWKDCWKVEEATQEEIDWLDLCIENNKFMEKPKPYKYTVEYCLNHPVAIEFDNKKDFETCINIFDQIYKPNHYKKGIFSYYFDRKISFNAQLYEYPNIRVYSPTNNYYLKNNYEIIQASEFIKNNMKQTSKSIIGYKLIKEYPNIFDRYTDLKKVGDIINTGGYIDTFSNFPEFWEPVYNQYKVGDIVICKYHEGNGLDENEQIGEIVDNSFSSSATGLLENNTSWNCIIKQNNKYYRVNSNTAIVRKLEEKDCNKILGYDVKVDGEFIHVGCTKVKFDLVKNIVEFNKFVEPGQQIKEIKLGNYDLSYESILKMYYLYMLKQK